MNACWTLKKLKGNLKFVMKLDLQLVYLALGPCDVDDLHPRDRLLQLQNLRSVAARSKRIKRNDRAL